MALNLHVADTLGYDTDNFPAIINAASTIAASDEGFVASLRNVLDLFIRSGKVLKTSIFRMNRSIKVSEMEKYVNDHTLVVKSVENLNYFDVQDIGVDKPYGMKQKYITVIDTLNQILHDLDAEAMMNIAIKSFTKIREQYLRDEDITKESSELYTTLNVKRGMLDKAAKDLKALFVQGDQGAKFKDMFGSMEEFRAVKTKTIEAEQYLNSAKVLSERADVLVGTLGDITALKDSKLSTSLKTQLAESALLMARICDTYGTCATHVMAVAHNLTLVYNALYAKVK